MNGPDLCRLSFLCALLLCACRRAEESAEPQGRATPAVKRQDLLAGFAPANFARPLPQRREELPGLAVRTLAEGKGEDIRYGMIGRFHIVGTLANGSFFHNTIDGEPELVRLLPPMLPSGLAIAMDGMKIGERRSVDVPPELGFGDKGDLERGVPGHARLLYDVELIEVVHDLQAGIIQEGTGPELEYGQTGSFVYTGVLQKDGTVFDSTAPGEARPLVVAKDAVVAGWYLGLPGMKAGEKRRLVVPPLLAYGETGPPKIGKNETLVFEFELREITAGAPPLGAPPLGAPR